ncbi:MAG TPA: hypothetical protein VH969_24105 [Actinophytocola sp.]|jgi:hypothetical protein|uniref:hypothetical protein n=1 Tax=Actinophytocola sp. TaxID=1872138 RepID=UPI002F9532D5
MVSRDEVVAWAAGRFGDRHAETRTVDGGFAFWVDTQPDTYHDGYPETMAYGNGPVVIVKATGEVWHLASNPATMPVLNARSEAELEELLREASYNPDIPDEILGESRAEPPDPAARKIEHPHLVRWLASFGWAEPACRITDRTFAFVVEPTPAIANGNGPICVVKRTAGVWYLGTSPAVQAAVHQTRTEAEFYAALRLVIPEADPRVPHDRVPPRFADPFR